MGAVPAARRAFSEVFLMPEFLAQNYGSILVGAILLVIVALIVRKLVKDKRAGKSSCGGNCSACGHNCAACGGHCAESAPHAKDGK